MPDGKAIKFHVLLILTAIALSVGAANVPFGWLAERIGEVPLTILVWVIAAFMLAIAGMNLYTIIYLPEPKRLIIAIIAVATSLASSAMFFGSLSGTLAASGSARLTQKATSADASSEPPESAAKGSSLNGNIQANMPDDSGAVLGFLVTICIFFIVMTLIYCREHQRELEIKGIG